MTEQQIDLRERELDYWMTRAYEAEKRAWQAEKRIEHLEDTARVLVKEALNAEADRDWNLRSSRIAKKKRIEANARADQAEARIQAVEDVLAAWHVEPGESGLADDLLRALNT